MKTCNIFLSLDEFRHKFRKISCFEVCLGFIHRYDSNKLSESKKKSQIEITNERLINLTFLAFESKPLENVPADTILCHFNEQKNRKL